MLVRLLPHLVCFIRWLVSNYQDWNNSIGGQSDERKGGKAGDTQASS